MWVDWNALGRQSSAAERAPPPVQKRDRADAASLGQRVGEVVASGDCAIGERLAREAGDIPLASAVRAHCYGVPNRRPSLPPSSARMDILLPAVDRHSAA